jgi:two-component system cell cycle response regulator
VNVTATDRAPRPWLGTLGSWCFAAVALTTVLYSAHVYLGLGGHATDAVFSDGAYNAAMVGAALTLMLRAFTRRSNRAPLALIAGGMLMWALGDVYYTVVYSGASSVPTPSFDDALYLSYYPLVYVGVSMLVRSRSRAMDAAVLLDGLIAGLGLAAVAAGIALDPIISATGGSLSVVATNLAYPIGDLALVVAVVTAIGAMGWRPGRTWGLVALGLAVQAFADTVYLVQVAENTYVENGWVEPLWPIASTLVLAGMWLRPAHAQPREQPDDWRRLAMPSAGAIAAIGLLFVDHGNTHVNTPARILALATLLAVAVRVTLAFRESKLRQLHTRRLAVTDPLTGLGNRRMLVEDLDAALASATPADQRLLVLFDLNGFKLYNDTFGHPAGDALLTRLGRNLRATAEPYGRAYRMGGDEFCALLAPGATPVEALASATQAALSEAGEGFKIDASFGVALLPADACEAGEALQLADRRLYANKEQRPSGVKHQLRGVLLQILSARMPALIDHLDGVAALALQVGRELGLEPEQLDELMRAAEMHDIGKTAIPETILDKPGPLDEHEWEFMRRHTILGERILSAAPALLPVARLVRSSHERWDGGGYPDGLAGEEIPVGSRIIFACDAFDAITSERSYQAARSEQDALAEMARCAGTQFDPAVVRALEQVVAERAASAARDRVPTPAELADETALNPLPGPRSPDWARS